MNSKAIFYIVIFICLFQLSFRFIYAEMYPSLLYPAFSLIPRLNIGQEVEKNELLKNEKISNIQALIAENPKLKENTSFTKKDILKATTLKIIYRIKISDTIYNDREIDKERLFYSLGHGRENYVLREKFFEYPASQKHFWLEPEPYSETDLFKVKSYLKQRVNAIFNTTKEDKKINDASLIFKRVSKKTGMVIYETKVKLD